MGCLGCIGLTIWLPLLALGGYFGYLAGLAIAGEGGAVIGAILGVLLSHFIQWIIWASLSNGSGSAPPPLGPPPPWWDNHRWGR